MATTELKLPMQEEDDYVLNAPKKFQSSLPKHVLDEIRAYMTIDIMKRPRPPNTPGVFLHVGKAGGSSLCSVLQNACHSFVRKPCPQRTQWENGTLNETFVGALTTYIHTPDFHMLGDGLANYTDYYQNTIVPKKSSPAVNSNDNSNNEAPPSNYYPAYSFYVASLRDPFTKFVSAFTYLHPDNGFVGVKQRDLPKKCRLYYQCFPTLEDFATLVGDDPLDFDYPYPLNEVYTENCTHLARASLSHKVRYCNYHLYWNTKTILERIPGWNHKTHRRRATTATNTSVSSRPEDHNSRSHPNKEDHYAVDLPFVLLVIRVEHNNQDFYTTNQLLGDPHPVEWKNSGAHHVRVQTWHNVSRTVSNLGRSRLCRGLLPEYKVYLQALSIAINLRPTDRQSSLELARTSCPDLGWLFQYPDFI